MSDWRDTNDMYWVPPKKEEKEPEAVVLEEEEQPQEETEDEIKLVEGKWLRGEDGFEFNEKCKIQVKAEFLKDTGSTKVTMKTFVVYNDEEEDLNQQVEANLDKKTGVAEAEVTLFYGEKFHEDYSKDTSVKCDYKFTVHSNVCKKDIDSELLEMPNEELPEFDFSF